MQPLAKLPARQLLVGRPEGLPFAELLTNVKSGPLIAMYLRLFRRFGITPKGVIHLGAHVGEEALPYLLMGYRRALFVEPDPTCYEALVTNLAYVEKVARGMDAFCGLADGGQWCQARRVAVGDREGETELFVQPNDRESSILPPTTTAPARTLTVPLTTLDTLLEELPEGWQREDLNVLYANIQGAELIALRGARATLRHIDFAYIEINLVSRYEGDPTVDQVVDFMDGEGFERVWGHEGLVPDVGYLVFVRR